MAQTLFPLLVNAPGKRYVQLPEGTHTIMIEKNRRMLLETVQAFLDESREILGSMRERDLRIALADECLYLVKPDV
jgi:hypothetical protein